MNIVDDKISILKAFMAFWGLYAVYQNLRWHFLRFDFLVLVTKYDDS